MTDATLDDAREAAAIGEGLTYANLRESQRGLVRAYLRRDPREWKSCCGSACDPCVLRIGIAVDRARDVLGLPRWPSIDEI
ncbi:MAG: hypothetical protein U0234_32460 [Sandaracinus sp.]